MAYSEDHIALAAEYALGTLDAEERAQVETMMAVDREYAAIVQAWEFRLGSLNQMVGSIEPRPIVWEHISAAIGLPIDAPAPPVVPAAPPVPPPLAEAPPPPLPEAAPPSFSEPSVVEPSVVEPSETPIVQPSMIPPSSSGSSVFEPLQQPVELRQAPVTDDSNVVDLAGRVKRWRNIASAVSALAAVLVVMLGLQIFQPNALPQAIRPKPLIQTVEVKVPAPALAPSSQYVALLQGQSGGPAFIMTIDGATKNFTVRKVGAVPEVGKSFELWLISDKLPKPRSLGVIGASDFTARPLLASYDSDTINGATYAVTIEQAGGSPDGQPTTSPAFIGKLIETVPPAQK
ncbi:anti-sigma factor [Bradyrhizobium jicamae]|uniref:anti-sigma factor n=1 Tax=Bradyrhizobium jicamae TaxID=280332 RepID=UPI001BAE2358|nr:anti-sigma factor [Bradyrhizobium jicamae]MBR0752463.1 anti-sigma factor [Bradyrhizobium jicamae]